MILRKALAIGAFLCYNSNVAKKHALLFADGAPFYGVSSGDSRIVTQIR